MITDFSAWIGRSRETVDRLEPARSRALLAALGQDADVNDGDPLPLLHHWLYFWDVRPPAELSPDGMPARGDFLPPVDLPRRMWGGNRMEFHAPLRLGEEARTVSTVVSVQAKTGRSGDLVFVTVRNELFGGEGLAVRDEQDIIYLGPALPGAAPPSPVPVESPPADWRWIVEPDPVLLFRYSALTMNGHRIHYDRAYATGEEGYPGLLVHGPLQATLMVALAARKLPRPITRFQFRGVAPAFESAPISVEGVRTAEGAALWVEQDGVRCMIGSVECSP